MVWGDNSLVDWENSKGSTVDVTLVVTVLETEAYYGTTHTIKVTVFVPYTEATVTIKDKADLTYNTGMTDADKANMVLSVVKPSVVPALPEGFSATVWYLASEARTVPYTINIAQLDLGIAGNFLPDTMTIQIPVEEMWLNIGDDLTIPEAPSNELIKKILLEDLIPNYAADYVAGNITSEQLKQIVADIFATYPEIEEYYRYLGAHQFGENEKTDADGNVQETVYVTVPDYGYGTAESNICVLTLADTRDESFIKLNEGVNVTYGKYTKEELLALLLNGVYDADGNKLDGVTVEFVTDVVGLPASEASEITVKFAGNEDYKPTTATATIVINRAPVTVAVDNQIVKWGTEYNKLPVTTDPANVDNIQFIVGLDVSNVNVDGGIKGILGNVQLLLPEELQDMLVMVDDLIGDKLGTEVSFADGASMKLSELQAVVSSMDDLFAGTEYEEYFRVLLKMLESLPTETADVEIVIGGELPSNVGVYLVGAVTADSNYETAVGAGMLVIYPDGIKADIAWNQNDDNYVITNTLLTNGLFDAEAHATTVGAGGTLEEATAQIAEIFLGVNIDGEITLETDPSKLNVGAYVEVAMIANWGNQMYYSDPIARPFIVVAESLDVDFVDNNGNINNDRHFEFFNVPQNGMEGNLLITYKQDGDGYKAGDKVTADYTVKYYYVGVQTNGKPYASTTAPTHAGVYTITAVIVIRDNTGYITHAGQGIGALVIEPSKSTIDVENEAIKYDGSEHKVNGFVDANSVNVPGLKPDTTIISAGIYADLDANTGLDAIKGNVNIDMPDWMDRVFNELNILEAGYADGISAERFLAYVEKLEAGLIELGIETDAFDEIVSVIEQMPGKTTLTFHDDKGYTEVGAYLIIGVVTDSDHYPSVDAGIVVIYPDIDKAELNWNYNDANNIFTIPALNNIDMSASAYQDNVLNQEYTNKISYLTVGVTEDGRIVVTALPNSITSNGAYTQVAYIPTEVNSQITIAAPIMRNFIVVPQTADIEITNTKVTYGDKYQMPIIVKDMNGNVIEGAKLGNLTVTYINLGTGYYSTVAPTEVGSYTVVAVYAEYDGDELAYYGIAVGNLTIVPADADYTLTDKDHACNTENSIDSMISNGNNLPYAIYVVTNVSKGEVNVILPAGWEITFQVGDTVEDLIAALEKLPTVIEDTRIVEALKSVLSSIEMQTLTVNGEQPTEYGEYNVTAIAFGDKNYNLAKASATLSIAHSYGEVTYSGDGKTSYTATRKCSCGDTQTVTATISSEVTKEATCTETGVRTYTATFTEDWATGKTTTEDIAKKAHTDADGNHKCDDCGADMGSNNTPAIGIPSLTGDNVYGFNVDYANKILYIDAEKTGLTVEQFVDQLKTSVFNDSDNEAEVVVTYQGKVLSGIELIRTESQVSLIAENENDKVTVKYDVVVIGDVNRNGEVDSGDATLIQRYFFKEVELTELQADAADTNRSGEIESGDAVKNQVKYNDAANYQSNLHSYTQATSNGDATCEQDGTMTLVCTANHNCSAKSITVPEAGSAKGHTYVRKEEAYVCDDCKKIAVNI